MKLLFIGGGNMAQALAGGLLARGRRPADVAVVEINAETRNLLSGRYGVTCFPDITSAKGFTADVTVLAVKPQQMRDVATELAAQVGDSLVVSIAAGIRLNDLARWLGGHRLLVRAMPNTPALIGKGIAGLYALPQVSPLQRELAATLLEAVGEVVWLDHEDQLDAVTAVSGSGPAYVFYFLEALERAGVAEGLPPDTARQLAFATFEGAVALARGSSDDPATLRAKVTSKGGTTEAALRSMETAGLAAALVVAVHAATLRSHELGEEFGRN